jgi:hypothetical protein
MGVPKRRVEDQDSFPAEGIPPRDATNLGLALQTSMVDRCLIPGYQSLRGDLNH